MKKIQTVGYIIKDGKVLLGMKKRDFGAGYWNGFGGKVEEGESLEGSLAREFEEEAGIKIGQAEEVGIITFCFEDSEIQPEVHFFRISDFAGTPTESEEMRPKWFECDLESLPLDSMWPSDRIWLPHFLAGKKFEGDIHFGENNIVLSSEISNPEQEGREGRPDVW